MNIQQLKYFVTIAETGQITEAAQRLYIAQPPLSRSLRRLESELGVILFTRTKRGLELTDAGTVFYEESKRLLYNYQEMLSALQEANSGVRGNIRIGSGYPTIPLLAEKLALFQEEYPSVEIYIEQEDPDELIEMLKKDEVDMIFLPHLVDDASFNIIPLAPDPMVLVVNPLLDPAPEEETVPVEKLKGIPFCMLRGGDFYGYNGILIRECQRHGFMPRILCQCNSAATAMVLVAQGLGLSYQPKMIVDALAHQNLYAKAIRGFESTVMPVIVLNRNGYINKAAQTFLAQFQTEEPPRGDEPQRMMNDEPTEDNPGGAGTLPGDADGP